MIRRSVKIWKKRKCFIAYLSWTVRGSIAGGGGEIFRTRPDRPWVPPGPRYDGYRSSAEVKERVELYLYSTCGSSWRIMWWSLSLFFMFNFSSRSQLYIYIYISEITQREYNFLNFYNSLPVQGIAPNVWKFEIHYLIYKRPELVAN